MCSVVLTKIFNTYIIYLSPSRIPIKSLKCSHYANISTLYPNKLAFIANIINKIKPFRVLIDVLNFNKVNAFVLSTQISDQSQDHLTLPLVPLTSRPIIEMRSRRAPYQIVHGGDICARTRRGRASARVCARPNQFINKRRKLKLITASHVRLSLLIFTRSVTRSASFYYHLPHLTPLTLTGDDACADVNGIIRAVESSLVNA